MVRADDWRLRGQEAYLAGVALIWRAWKPADPRNDHDHCAFCWEKFADYDGCLHEGYGSEDGRWWVCGECYEDFRARFAWRTQDE